MLKKNKLTNIKVIVFDFDGVFTNNYAMIDSRGKESVIINRADGIGIKILKKNNYKLFVVSSEKDSVVKARSKKLGIKCFNGVINKLSILNKISKNLKLSLQEFMFVGNDINDYEVMNSVGYRVCPNDSHYLIRKISNKVLKSNGGEGITREIVENLLKINIKDYFNL